MKKVILHLCADTGSDTRPYGIAGYKNHSRRKKHWSGKLPARGDKVVRQRAGNYRKSRLYRVLNRSLKWQGAKS